MARRSTRILGHTALATLAFLSLGQPGGAQTQTGGEAGATGPTGQTVMARTGACYAPTDPLHAGVPAQASFPDMEACVAAGGWDRRAGVPAGLFDTIDPHTLVPPATPAIAAPRAGDGPADNASSATGGDLLATWLPAQGCRAGEDILLAIASRAPVVWSMDGCVVEHGLWVDSVTGAPQTDPTRVVVAPAVPFAWADARGGNGWTASQRSAFARDPANILVLDVRHAEAWIGRTPMEQQPSDPFKACAWANRFAEVLARHPIALGEGDARALAAAQEQACAAPNAETIAALHARQDAEQAALRAAFDAARGIDRQEAAWGQAIGLPMAPDAAGMPEDLARPASPIPVAGPVPAGAEAAGRATMPLHSVGPMGETSTMDTVAVDGDPAPAKPPIATPGVFLAPRPAAPAAAPPPSAAQPPNTQAPPQPPQDTGPPLRLEDLRRLTLPALVQVLNQDVVVVGFNAPGEPLDPYAVLDALGIDPAEALAELARQGVADAENGIPTAPSAQAPAAATAPVEVRDPSLPAFDGDPAMMGLSTPGAQILMGE